MRTRARCVLSSISLALSTLSFGPETVMTVTSAPSGGTSTLVSVSSLTYQYISIIVIVIVKMFNTCLTRHELNHVSMNGQHLRHDRQTVHLGVTLDRKLSHRERDTGDVVKLIMSESSDSKSEFEPRYK